MSIRSGVVNENKTKKSTNTVQVSKCWCPSVRYARTSTKIFCLGSANNPTNPKKHKPKQSSLRFQNFADYDGKPGTPVLSTLPLPAYQSNRTEYINALFVSGKWGVVPGLDHFHFVRRDSVCGHLMRCAAARTQTSSAPPSV